MSIGVEYPGLTDRPFVLDATREATLSVEQVSRFSIDVYQLVKLGGGLNTLYDLISDVEQLLEKPDGRTPTILDVDIDRHLPLRRGMAECTFHWYSVSLCNYCDLVWQIAKDTGWVSSGLFPDRKLYRDEVLGSVRVYRDKVAAHFARIWPKDENSADVTVSTLPQVCIQRGRLAVARVTYRVDDNSTQLNYAWSLTMVHEGLGQRYPSLSVVTKGTSAQDASHE